MTCKEEPAPGSLEDVASGIGFRSNEEHVAEEDLSAELPRREATRQVNVDELVCSASLVALNCLTTRTTGILWAVPRWRLTWRDRDMKVAASLGAGAGLGLEEKVEDRDITAQRRLRQMGG
jgi:hypothetical protein